jgi:hypothetical protein
MRCRFRRPVPIRSSHGRLAWRPEPDSNRRENRFCRAVPDPSAIWSNWLRAPELNRRPAGPERPRDQAGHASWNLASPAGLEPACLCVRSAALLRLSYGEKAWRLAPIAGIEPASSPVNGRPRAPCSPDGKKWWRNRESNPGRRSCKDQLQPAAFPVPGRGFEPRSPRLQRGAFTRLAYQAHWRGCRQSKPGLMSGAHLLDLQAIPACYRLVGSGGNRTPCPMGPRLRRGDGTSLS